MKRILGSALLALLLAAPSPAAVYMKSHVYGTGPDGRPQDEVEMRFEGWFDDDRAVIRVLESNNEVFARGTIFVDGTTMTLYDPEENTCMPWDLQAMMRFAGQMMETVSGILELEFGEPQIEILERKSGVGLLGRSVDYVKYRSDWTMSFKVPLTRKRTYQNESLQEVWFDRSLRDELPSMGVFMDPDSFTTGYEQMDRAIAASAPPIDGVMLKSHAVSTMTNQKGKEETTTSTTEVTELDRSASDPPSGFAPPSDCEVVAMVPPAEGAGADDTDPAASEEGGKPWSKVKIKNPFKKKKDGG